MCWKSREARIFQYSLLRKLVDYVMPFCFLMKSHMWKCHIYISWFILYSDPIPYVYFCVAHAKNLVGQWPFLNLCFCWTNPLQNKGYFTYHAKTRKISRGMNNWAQGVQLSYKSSHREENIIFLDQGRAVPICSSYGLVSKHSYPT